MLAEALKGAAGDVDSALRRYERRRRPDVHALGTMDHQVGLSMQTSWLMHDLKIGWSIEVSALGTMDHQVGLPMQMSWLMHDL